MSASRSTISPVWQLVAAFLVGGVVGSMYSTAKSVTPTKYGRFLSDPVVKLKKEGRDVELLEDFVFIDSEERAWVAEKGQICNGASIPQAFWSIVGGPFEGKYRNASIVHDAECVKRKRSAPEVHRMFYDACLAGGLPEKDAMILFWAVANFGPQWELKEKFLTMAIEIDDAKLEGPPSRLEPTEKPARAPTQGDIEWAKDYFKKNSPSPEMIPLLRPKS